MAASIAVATRIRGRGAADSRGRQRASLHPEVTADNSDGRQGGDKRPRKREERTPKETQIDGEHGRAAAPKEEAAGNRKEARKSDSADCEIPCTARVLFSIAAKGYGSEGERERV